MAAVTLYRTLNSTYEVDSTAKRIRRTAGINPPIQHGAEDGEWRQYETLRRTETGGLEVRLGKGSVIWTSQVIRVEPDAQAE